MFSIPSSCEIRKRIRQATAIVRTTYVRSQASPPSPGYLHHRFNPRTQATHGRSQASPPSPTARVQKPAELSSCLDSPRSTEPPALQILPRRLHLRSIGRSVLAGFERIDR
ncbi:hypothetical protein OJAV_G00236760 [Oryzias javanicus]|uniref:Uncharacterized protein n=1 Tax=Oryzias javanicus TaxID=123683 RepID=A0A3S2P933_ORYJA|nr:hypothetical protein OJAV_G00236760 [Oryzias javanicus]